MPMIMSQKQNISYKDIQGWIWSRCKKDKYGLRIEKQVDIVYIDTRKQRTDNELPWQENDGTCIW